MTPTTEITATLFEVAAYEDSSVTVDAKIEIFVHGLSTPLYVASWRGLLLRERTT